MVFDSLQGGINLRNIIIHFTNKATLIAVILNNFQAFWRGWFNPRVYWITLDNTGVHRNTLEYTGVPSIFPYTGVLLVLLAPLLALQALRVLLVLLVLLVRGSARNYV